MRYLRNRWALVRALAPAGVPLSGVLVTALFAAALLPAATALTLAWLVRRIEHADAAAGLGPLLVPLLCFAAALLLGHLSDALVAPLELLTKARINGHHRTQVMRVALAGDGLERLERPEVQRLIAEVSADPRNVIEFTPGDGATGQLRWLAGIVGIVSVCAVLAAYSWLLVAWMLLIVVCLRRLQVRQIDALVDKLRLAYREELHADVWREAAVSPSAGKDMRIFGISGWAVERIQHHIEAGNSPFWSWMIRIVRSGWITFALILMGLVPAYVGVTLGAIDGGNTIATQTAVLATSWALFRAFADTVDIHRMAGAVQVLASYEELRRLLPPVDRPAPTKSVPTTTSTTPGGAQPPAVRFEHVAFRYSGSTRDVLQDVDLELHPGELVALVGLNGAGKSTLIKLLSGLYRPTAGRITADGADIAAMEPARWRERLAVVFQDFVRYPLSALENVGLSRGGAPYDVAGVEQAAMEAGFAGVLERLPDGWQTPLARSRKDGVDLSGGQWQQVVLARAVYGMRQGARILVLDEPTAHLDVRTEFEVFGKLAAYRGETTVVLISHRLSTVRHADRIVVLDQGRIAESGPHDELMARGGLYAQMFKIQAERFQAGFDDRIEEGELA
ncbi:MAG TPA: ABC transporter ATP-binding protein [Dactylosporangium sp.]|nr:ABC transporter ATP-binding protein [Dactylosporangium sp.]